MVIVQTWRAVQNEGPMSEMTVRVCRNIFIGLGTPTFALIVAVFMGY